MQQISISQIKAARALLGWNQSDLAKASGLSLQAIAKMESGMTQPRSDTLRALQSAFEQSDIEFLEAPGVQMRREPFQVDVMRGREGAYRLYADIETSMANGGELLISGVDEIYALEQFGDRLWATIKRRFALGITPRLLIAEDDRNVIIGPSVYRAVPAAALSSSVPHFIYLNKLAIMQLKPTLQVILIESRAIADTYRALFEHNWQNGKELAEEGLNIIMPPEK